MIGTNVTGITPSKRSRCALMYATQIRMKSSTMASRMRLSINWASTTPAVPRGTAASR